MLPWPLDRGLSHLFPGWWWRNTFNALDDVTVSIPAGSAVGMVGPNGAGKTTLLRVISRVTAPTRGTVAVSGRVGALLDVVIGFHPDLTGRENVYLLGGMHGISRRAMEDRMARILEFAEIGDQADTPVKRYSAGMSGRLGFATITELDVDTLLVDEVLAVGDAQFQRKCVSWLDNYQSAGGTLLFVSHNLGLVRNMTERVIWLERGKVVDDGPPAQVLGRYARAAEHRDEGGPVRWRGQIVRQMRDRGLHRWGTGGARIEEVHVDPSSDLPGGAEVSITYRSGDVDRAVFCVGFVDDTGREIGAAASPPFSLRGEKGAMRCSIRPPQLREGIYFPVVAILSSDGVILDRWRLDRALVVDRDGEVGLAESFGPVEMGADWSEGDGG